MNDDLTLSKLLKLEDFKGPSFFEESKQFIFPSGRPLWLSDKEFLVALDVLLDPQPNPRGIYKLNVENLTVERLVEW